MILCDGGKDEGRNRMLNISLHNIKLEHYRTHCLYAYQAATPEGCIHII